MERAWFLQANPELYDIDGALAHLSTILWRVPQYSGEIRTGDIVAIWRAGVDAGVVAVGRVDGPPRVRPRPDEERAFVRSDAEERETTRVPIRVLPSPLASKASIAALLEFADHQILMAPRGTVFPMTDIQWATLRPLLAPPPDRSEDQPTPVAWPEPFGWEQRRRSVYPLPGGYSEYLNSLEAILTHVSSVRPDRPDFGNWMRDIFATSGKASDLIRDFLTRISLVREAEGFLGLTTEAQTWLTNKDPGFLVALLHSRVRFIGEMLGALTQPATAEAIRIEANASYGMTWGTRAQVDRRRGWLQSAGMVTVDDQGRVVLTETGVLVLGRLRLAPPRVLEEEARESERDVSVEAPPPARIDDLDELLSRFRLAASNTADPSEFERVTAEIFRFLGFAAEHLGRAGRTDVLVVAPLGPTDGYRVAVDCKTTSHEAVSDPQIDWLTLREHRAQHQADYSAVVGPAFRASRVEQRARAEGVALLDVETLAGACTQHREIPLGLHVYRRLFDPAEDAAAESVASIAEEEARWLALVSDIVRVITKLQTNEGPVVARDIYWNLDREADPWVTVEDIEAVVATLASPAIGLLHETQRGYVTLGSQETCARRLRRLSDLTAAPRTQSSDV
jgi:Restriction endonuclease